MHLNKENKDYVVLIPKPKFFSVGADNLPAEFDFDKALRIQEEFETMNTYLTQCYNNLRGNAKIDAIEVPSCVKVAPKQKPRAKPQGKPVSEAISSGELPTG